MTRKNELEEEIRIVDLPVSGAVTILKPSEYGSVEGLNDSELTDPDELERQVFLKDFAPILALPVKQRGSWIKPTYDEKGKPDYGAFGTIDFERLFPFNKAIYKIDKLKEELGDLIIRMEIIEDRMSGKASKLVLKHLNMGIINFDHIVDDDMQALAKLYLKTQRIRREIKSLKNFSSRS